MGASTASDGRVGLCVVSLVLDASEYASVSSVMSAAPSVMRAVSSVMRPCCTLVSKVSGDPSLDERVSSSAVVIVRVVVGKDNCAND